MEETSILSWFDITVLGYSVIIYAVSKWSIFISMYIRKRKGEDDTIAAIFSVIGVICMFLSFPVQIIAAIPEHFIREYYSDNNSSQKFREGLDIGYRSGYNDAKKKYGWD